MKQKTKLIMTLISMCMVITLGVIGILAVKTLNMSVGGNISFTAAGVEFSISDGKFKTTAGAEYTGVNSDTSKLKGFTMDTNTTEQSIATQKASWSGLNLTMTSQGDVVLYFTVTNKMPSNILYVNIGITLGTNKNNNMTLTATPNGLEIPAGGTNSQEVQLLFHIIDTTINAGLTGFNVSLEFSKEKTQASNVSSTVSNVQTSGVTVVGANSLQPIVYSPTTTITALSTQQNSWKNLDLTLTQATSTLSFTVQNTESTKKLRVATTANYATISNATMTVSAKDSSGNTITSVEIEPNDYVTYTVTFTKITSSNASSVSDFSLVFDIQEQQSYTVNLTVVCGTGNFVASGIHISLDGADWILYEAGSHVLTCIEKISFANVLGNIVPSTEHTITATNASTAFYAGDKDVEIYYDEPDTNYFNLVCEDFEYDFKVSPTAGEHRNYYTYYMQSDLNLTVTITSVA